MDFCRFVIRKKIRPDKLKEGINELPLPTSLKNFLKYED